MKKKKNKFKAKERVEIKNHSCKYPCGTSCDGATGSITHYNCNGSVRFAFDDGSGHCDFKESNLVSLSKLCEIVNARFTYILKVDGEAISFQGGCSTDYFVKHYRKLGYKIKRTTKR